MVALVRAGLVSAFLHAPLVLLPGPGTGDEPPAREPIQPVSLVAIHENTEQVQNDAPAPAPKKRRLKQKARTSSAPVPQPPIQEQPVLDSEPPLEQDVEPEGIEDVAEVDEEEVVDVEAELADVQPANAPANASEGEESAPQTQSMASVNVNGFDMGHYLAQMLAAIEKHKRYPRGALVMGLQGKVLVRTYIDETGAKVGEPEVVRSSGVGMLDDEALRMVRSARFPKPRGSLPQNPLPLHIPVNFSLQ